MWDVEFYAVLWKSNNLWNLVCWSWALFGEKSNNNEELYRVVEVCVFMILFVRSHIYLVDYKKENEKVNNIKAKTNQWGGQNKHCCYRLILEIIVSEFYPGIICSSVSKALSSNIASSSDFSSSTNLIFYQ